MSTRRKGNFKNIKVILCAGGAVLLALFLLWYFVFRKGGDSASGEKAASREIVMPDVIGMPYLEAEKLISAEFEKVGIYSVHFSITWVDSHRYEMAVAEQNPKPGAIVREGDSDIVAITVGEGWYTYMSHGISYELDEDIRQCFTLMPEGAYGGDIVEIRTEVLMDADIHVYANGYEVEKTHSDSDYWEYSFTMPAEDVTITAKWYTKGEVNPE